MSQYTFVARKTMFPRFKKSCKIKNMKKKMFNMQMKSIRISNEMWNLFAKLSLLFFIHRQFLSFFLKRKREWISSLKYLSQWFFNFSRLEYFGSTSTPSSNWAVKRTEIKSSSADVFRTMSLKTCVSEIANWIEISLLELMHSGGSKVTETCNACRQSSRF